MKFPTPLTTFLIILPGFVAGQTIDQQCLNEGGVPDNKRFDTCTLSVPNEDVAESYFNMAEYFNSGVAQAAGFIRLSSFIASGTLPGTADDLVNGVRDYVFCGKTYTTGVPGTPGVTDFPLLVFNPNFKVSCDGCILEMTATNETEGNTRIITTVDSEGGDFLPLEGFTPDASGLVVDGLTFTLAEGSEPGLSAIYLTEISKAGGLPVQLRNIVVMEMHGTFNAIHAFSSREGRAIVEISNLRVGDSSFRAPVVSISNGRSDCGCYRFDIRPGDAELCIQDATFSNLELDIDRNDPDNGHAPVAAAIFSPDRDTEIKLTDVCGEDLSSPNSKIFVVAKRDIFYKSFIDQQCLNEGGASGKQYDACTLSPPNEEVALGYINMADFFTSGQAEASGFVRPQREGVLPTVPSDDINFGSGEQSCFETTVEVLYTEFVLAGAVKAGLGVTGLVNSVRDYVLCDKTFTTGSFDAETLLPDIPGTDYPLLIFNPNFKVSCNSCILEMAASSEKRGETTIISTPNPDRLPPQLEGFTPDGTGLIVDGLEFTLADGTEPGFSAIALDRMKGGLPVQLRNIVVSEMHGTYNAIYVESSEETPNIEISNLVVEDSSFRSVAVAYVNGEDENSEDLDISEGVLCIDDATFSSLDLDIDHNSASSGYIPVAAAVFASDRDVDILLTDVCGEDLRAPNKKLFLVKEKNIFF